MTLDEPVDAQNPLGAAEPLITVVLGPGGTARVRQIASCAACAHISADPNPGVSDDQAPSVATPADPIAGFWPVAMECTPDAYCLPTQVL